MDNTTAACVLGVAALVAILSTAPPAYSASSVFTKDNAMALAELRAQEQPVISMALVALSGKSVDVAAAVHAAGGRVRYQFAAADFLSVVLPTQRVSSFLESPNIEAAGIDQPDADYRYRGLMPSEVAPERDVGASQPAPLGARPLDEPYDVLRALGADDFRRRHPRFDGRGVVIAQVEGMSDLLVPDLQTALDIHGREVPKFLDVLNNPNAKLTLDPEAPRSDWQWTALSAPLQARQGWVEHGGKRYRVPTDSASYRYGSIEIPLHVLMPINLPNSSDVQPAIGTDYYSLLREGLKKKTATFAVLWSDTARVAWLDSDRDGDFSNERPVREYRISHDVGVLGRDDPATSRRESRPYVLQKDGDQLSLNMDCNPHATMGAGTAGASRGRQGRLDGIAPGAQIIAIKSDRSYSGFSWALIAAFADERSDIVLIEASFPPAGGQARKDGRSLLGALLSRLNRRYPKPSFFTAGNFPVMSGVVDASIVPETISIGAYDAPESFQVHLGMRRPGPDTLHAIGSEGPAGNGALKPDLLSPSMMIAPRDGYLGNDRMNSLPGLYQLPEGYWVSGGTSAATPIAAGAAALLVSAAKQRGLAHDAARIKRALLASAHYLSGAGSYQQGAGVMRVGAAWEHLERYASETEALSIDVSAPVRTANSHLLSPPDQGIGIFELEGWRSGDRAVRRVKLTRRNGAPGRQKFITRWQGNLDATFEVAGEVELPLGEPVSLDIAIAPKTEGVYSATLQLVAQSQSTPAVTVPMTIVVPYELAPANGFAQTLQMEVPIVGRRAVFVRVPEGTDALTFEASHTSKLTFLALHNPAGDQMGFIMGLNPVSGKSVETIAEPAAGVWAVFAYDNTGRDAYFRAQPGFATLPDEADAPPPIKIDMRISAAAVALAAGRDDATGGGVLQDGEIHTITGRNTMAALEQAQLVGKVAALRSASGQIERGEQRAFDIDVRTGAEYLVASVKPTRTAELDADLYLFDCTGLKCTLARTARGYGAQERVFVHRPQAGRWRVILDATAADSGKMSYEYSDLFTLEDAGVIAVADRVISRPPAAAWQAQIKPWLIGPFDDDRKPVAALFVLDALRTSMLGAESALAAFSCKTFPYCETERRENVPLGLMLLGLGTPGKSNGMPDQSVFTQF